MFEVVHEFAVLGTACFMMALATVWYSPVLFGKVWMKETGLTDEMVNDAQSQMWTHLILTFVSYVVLLTLLAQVIAYAPVVALAPLQASGLLTLFVAAILIPVILSEGRSVRYFMVQVGFNAVFILLGTLILQYWPW